MLNSHVAQQFSTLSAARRGEDLGACGTSYPDRCLPHPAGCGVDQHLVTGPDAGQILQAVPGGGVRGGHRGGLGVGQARWKRHGQAGVTGDESAPTAVGGHAPDMVTNLVIGDVGPECCHHAGEIGARLRQVPLEAGVSAEGDQDIGEVDAGRADSDLDLSGTRWNPVERDELHRLQITRRADLHAHAVVLLIQDGGLPLFGAQRGGTQARRVPLIVAPSGLVLFTAGEQLACHLLGVCLLVDVDVGGAQVRVLGADHPQQAAQPALLEVDAVIAQHRLGAPGHDIQPGRLAGDVWQFPGDAHHILNVTTAENSAVGIRFAVLGSGEHDHIGKFAGIELAAQLRGSGNIVGMLRPTHSRAFSVVQLQRIRQLGGRDIRRGTGADQQPRSGVDIVPVGQLSLLPFDGQQPLAQHPIAGFVLGDLGAELQSAHGHQDRPVLVQDVKVGFHPGRSGVGHPCIAVVGGAGRSVGTDPAHAQRQPQTAAPYVPDFGMRPDRLETGIQQGGVNPIGALL